MTLHATTEILKKVVIYGGSLLGIIILGWIIFKSSGMIKDMLYPVKVEAPNKLYDALPGIVFPKNATDEKLNYTMNTVSGTFPVFPDRLYIYPVVQEEPSFSNLKNAKTKLSAIGFTDYEGKPIPEIALQDSNYEWDDTSDIKRKMVMNIITFNFLMTSSYTDPQVVAAAKNLSDELSDETDAIKTSKFFLDYMELFPNDIDLNKTQNHYDNINYYSFPKDFSIQNGTLVPASSLSDAQAIRVDLYQKDLEYDLVLNTVDGKLYDKKNLSFPILYPDPPFSTMSFWVAAGENQPRVVAADFVHHEIQLPAKSDPTPVATYPIKTAKDAFEELKNGNAFIASYWGQDNNVTINDIFLAYYLGKDQQDYLMPIIVFEGKNGFLAYVSAVQNDLIK